MDAYPRDCGTARAATTTPATMSGRRRARLYKGNQVRIGRRRRSPRRILCPTDEVIGPGLGPSRWASKSLARLASVSASICSGGRSAATSSALIVCVMRYANPTFQHEQH